MKKVFLFLIIVIALTGISCQTTPASGEAATGTAGEDSSGVRTGGESQASINEAFAQVYYTYRGSLDMTGAQEYTVQRGDTLSEITRRFYGNLTGVGNAGRRNGFFFPLLMEASNTTIVDPDLIEPGMRLLIPDLRRNLNNPEARSAIKNSLNEVAQIYVRKGRPADAQGLRTLANSL